MRKRLGLSIVHKRNGGEWWLKIDDTAILQENGLLSVTAYDVSREVWYSRVFDPKEYYFKELLKYVEV